MSSDSENEEVEDSTNKRRSKRQKTTKNDYTEPTQTETEEPDLDREGPGTSQKTIKQFFPVLPASGTTFTSGIISLYIIRPDRN